jgi:polar amino acid transport system substrate-binding protein
MAAEPVTVGWVPRLPYAFEEVSAHHRSLTGLDVEVLREAAVGADLDLRFERFADDHQLVDALRRDAVDLGVGFDTAPKALHGMQLHEERDALWLRHGAALASDTDRICVVEGEDLIDPTLSGWVADPAHRDRILREATEADCVADLAAGRVDGIIGDHLAIALASYRQGVGDQMAVVGEEVTQPALLLWSERARSQGTDTRLESALQRLRDDGTYDHLVRAAIYPIIASVTVDSSWYWWIDILGTVAFILSGLVIARKEQYSIAGAFVLGTLPAVGGGIVRDLLCGRDPVGFLRSPVYALLIIGLIALGWFLFRVVGVGRERGSIVGGRATVVIDVFDTIGLGSFTVTGVAVAIAEGLEPLWLWGPLFAGLSSCGGGIIRDMIRSQKPASLTTSFYPEIAIFWGFLFSMWLSLHGLDLTPETFGLGVIVTMVGASATRAWVVHKGIDSPLF